MHRGACFAVRSAPRRSFLQKRGVVARRRASRRVPFSLFFLCERVYIRATRGAAALKYASRAAPRDATSGRPRARAPRRGTLAYYAMAAIVVDS